MQATSYLSGLENMDLKCNCSVPGSACFHLHLTLSAHLDVHVLLDHNIEPFKQFMTWLGRRMVEKHRHINRCSQL